MTGLSSDTQIKMLLNDLLGASPYVTAVGVVRVSGLAVVAVMPGDIQQDHVSAMAAVMLQLGERITEAMHAGALDKVYIKGRDGHILLTSVGQSAVLVLMAREQAPLGMLFVEMRQSAGRLKKLV